MANIKKYECYFDGDYLGTVQAVNKNEATEAMERKWPWLCYGFEVIETEQKQESELLDYALEEFGIF